MRSCRRWKSSSTCRRRRSVRTRCTSGCWRWGSPAGNARRGGGGAGGGGGGGRGYRRWVAERGLWLQFDWGDGPRVGGRKTYLFCAWLAWSRFRVVIPVWDQTMGTLIACVDATLRRLGGVPMYLLADNAKTVTVEHVAGGAGRHPMIGGAGRAQCGE